MVRVIAIWATLFVFAGLQSCSWAANKDMTGKLLEFGYLRDTAGTDRDEQPTPEELAEALKTFQKFNGLTETGIYDDATQKLLFSKRCGNKDIDRENDTYRPASFTAVARWNKKELTWNLVKFSKSKKLSFKDQIRNVQKGLEHWSKVTGLTFRKVSGMADIMISFEKRTHGDNNPFDGPSGVLAHAFFPGRMDINGDTHFDDDELWTQNTDEGTNLEIVAAHEFGHALGLGHSSVPESLMAPYYRGYNADFQLHQDDIAGIQRLYGKKVTTTKKPTTKPTPEPTTTQKPTTAEPTTTLKLTTTPEPSTPKMTTQKVVGDLPTSICHRPPKSKIQAAFTDPRGAIYIFLDNGYVISNTTGSHKIADFFPDGPKFVDAAAYSNEHSLLFLFRGLFMWMYTFDANNNKFSRNFMKKLEIKVDAATVIRDNYGWERIFLFAGEYMHEYHQYFRRVGDAVKIQQMWYGAPDAYDAVITNKHEINFIHGDRYTTVEKQYNVVVKTPRSIKTLLKCN